MCCRCRGRRHSSSVMRERCVSATSHAALKSPRFMQAVHGSSGLRAVPSSGCWSGDCIVCRMSPRFRPEPKPATPAASNVRTIVELERRAALERSRADTIGETVARWAGTLGFVLVQVALFLVWSAWNTWAPVRWRFDPYPYGLLTFLVSLEGVLIATFVLI